MLSRHITIPYWPYTIRGNDGWWDKLQCFGTINSRILFFDLDTIILDNIDDIATYDGEFMMMKNFKWGGGAQKDKYASAIMNIAAGFGDDICTEYEKDPKTVKANHKGDQKWIEQCLDDREIVPDLLQDMYTGVYSYKKHCQNGLPKDARIVCFHGEPKNHELLHLDWVKENWR